MELSYSEKVAFGKDLINVLRADIPMSSWLIRFFAYCEKERVKDYESLVMDILTIGMAEEFIDNMSECFASTGVKMIEHSGEDYRKMVAKTNEMCKALNQEEAIWNLPAQKQLIGQAMIKAGERMVSNE